MGWGGGGEADRADEVAGAAGPGAARRAADMADVEEPVADEVYRTAGLRELEADEEREFGAAPQREADVPQVFLQLPPGAAGEPDEGISEDVLLESPLQVREEHSVLVEAERVVAYGVRSDLADSLQHLREVARRRNEDSSRSSNTWTRIEISPDIVLSVRGITEEDEEVVERVRRAMAKVVGRRTTDP